METVARYSISWRQLSDALPHFLGIGVQLASQDGNGDQSCPIGTELMIKKNGAKSALIAQYVLYFNMVRSRGLEPPRLVSATTSRYGARVNDWNC